jgi:aspartate 1-decarboxylase
VTETSLDYVGSVTIDQDLMDASGIVHYEMVHIWNITNGSRMVTYAIPGERGSGVICLNGAAAHLHQIGDKVIIAAFANLEAKDAESFVPNIIVVDENNKIEQIIKSK